MYTSTKHAYASHNLRLRYVTFHVRYVLRTLRFTYFTFYILTYSFITSSLCPNVSLTATDAFVNCSTTP